MNQQRSQPLAPISTNIVSKKSPVAHPKYILGTTNVPPFMENRDPNFGEVGYHGVDFNALEAHESDSSYEHHMLAQMRQHQEALETGQRKRIPFSRANKTQPRNSDVRGQPRASPVRTSWTDLQDNASSGSGSSTRSDDRRPWGWRTNQAGNDWFEKAKRGLAAGQTPVVKDIDTIDMQYPVQSVEESPLSHKGSTRGTPGTAQVDKRRPVSYADNEDILGDLSGSLLASTPAFPKKRFMSIKEVIRAEKEAKNNKMQLPTPPPEDLAQARNTNPRSSSARRAVQQTAREKSQKLEKDPLDVAKEALHAVLDSPKPIPQSQRDDTRNLLKLLARSASNSPSPAQAEKKPSPIQTTTETSKPTLTSRWQSIQNPKPQQSLTSSASKPTKSSSHYSNPSIRTVPPTVPLSQRDSLSKSNFATPTVAKTPKPVGAWIDTPAPSKTIMPEKEAKTGQSAHATSETASRKPKDPSGGLSMLSRPKSALAAVLGLAKDKDNKTTEDMGDATIHSLEDILEGSEIGQSSTHMPSQSVDNADIVTSIEDQAALREIFEHRITSELHFTDSEPPSTKEQALIKEIVDQRISRGTEKSGQKTAKAQPKTEEVSVTPRRKERMEEELQLQRMTDRVNNLSSYTASMRAGLKTLERNISSAGECGHCDCPGNCFGAHPFSALARATLRAFLSTKDGKRRPTWFGVITSIMFFWLVLETLMCWSYCRPVYASWTSKPFGPFEAPEPPYVVVSWLFDSWLSIPRSILSACFRPLRGLVLDMLADDTVPTATFKSTASGFASTATAVLADASDWSMDADEFL